MHFEQTRAWARFQQILKRRVYTFSTSKLVLFNELQNAGDGVAVERKILGPFNYLEANRLVFFREIPISEYARILYDAGVRVNAVCVRWSPTYNQRSQVPAPARVRSGAGSSQKFVEANIVPPQILVHQVPPKATLMVGLLGSEAELLGEMHEKTRYNIRLAERKGVEVREAGIQDGFEKFWHLIQETADRDHIGIHSREYYKKMLETVRGVDIQAHLFLAECEGEPLATAVLIICGDTATYLHGGSSSMQRNLMAPYALQWRMMLYAKLQGCRWYDMWGVAPVAQQTQNYSTWAGITRFKMGFGGEVLEGAGTYDIICRPLMYRLLSLGRYIKNLNH